MLRLLGLLLCLCCVDASIAAQPIDSARSSAQIGVRLRWVKTLECAVRRFDGEVKPVDDHRRRVSIRFDVRTLDVEGNESFVRHAKSAEFFDVERYPWVVFESAPFTQALLQSGGDLRGELFLRGAFHPVVFQVLPAQCQQPGIDCPIKVSGKVSRSEFGMTARRFTIKDKVSIDFSMVLTPGTTTETAGK